MRTPEASEIAKLLFEEIFCRYGAPDVIVTDRGSNFLSKLVTAVCERFQVTRHHTSSYHPQSNSVVERVNGTLGQAMRTLCNENQNNWADFIPAIMMAFRNSVSATTGFTPYQILFGRQMRLPIDCALILRENLPVNIKQYVEHLNQQIKVTELLVNLLTSLVEIVDVVKSS